MVPVTRVLSPGAGFELGLFDPIEDQPYWHVPPSAVSSAAHTALARDATRQALVLLQNPPRSREIAADRASGAPADAGGVGGGASAAGVLPFLAGGRVAVVGPHANDRTHILGNYLGQARPLLPLLPLPTVTVTPS